jgi:hypothetical protein
MHTQFGWAKGVANLGDEQEWPAFAGETDLRSGVGGHDTPWFSRAVVEQIIALLEVEEPDQYAHRWNGDDLHWCDNVADDEPEWYVVPRMPALDCPMVYQLGAGGWVWQFEADPGPYVEDAATLGKRYTPQPIECYTTGEDVWFTFEHAVKALATMNRPENEGDCYTPWRTEFRSGFVPEIWVENIEDEWVKVETDDGPDGEKLYKLPGDWRLRQ